MKIALFELEDWEKEIAEKELREHEIIFIDNALNEKQLEHIKDCEVLVVFIYSPITKDIIDKLPNLKLIAAMSVGVDHIDIMYCKKKGIIVSNVPTYGENTVAEHTFALILALSRKLYPSIKRTHEQHSFETDESLRGFDLKGKILGVIGGGHIGKHVARIAVGFEMNVIVFDHHQDDKVAKNLGFNYVDLDALLQESDIITLHVPYNESTHHLINESTINKMKKGVFIINTSRGGIIDTQALMKGLESGKIAGTALDVLEGESEIKEERAVLKEEFKSCCDLDLRTILADHLLMEMDNVIITPHNAFNSKEALQRILNTTIQNIKGFLKGKPQNVV